MILESQMFDDEESPMHEIVDDFMADHFEPGDEIPEGISELIHDAVIYGAMHALSRLKYGCVIRDKNDEIVDRKLYTLEELLVEAEICMGLHDEEDSEDTDDEDDSEDKIFH